MLIRWLPCIKPLFMRTALIFVLIGVLLLALLRLTLKVTDRQSKMDIRIHTTYFVITKKTLLISTLLFLSALFLIGWTINLL